ncbi:hypothetical protein BsWGS_01711 [Bradybaena similaris]
MSEENLKVAVRVRPFNSKEISRNAQLIIGMSGQQTTIKDPDNMSAAPKQFSFDYSYWSHDGYQEEKDGYLSPKDSKYDDQKKIFNNLGRGVLENAWKGYNCSLFAYGQTGSGKSYSIVGFGNNKGLVPLTCEELFKGIAEKRKSPDKDNDFVVTLSMLEIYNEQVRDLLKKSSQKGGLKVRQHPGKGFYVETLTVASVDSYEQIENKVNEGTRNRTMAATLMNATSSRAHTIVAINFVQKQKNKEGKNMTKSSIINLVDLAGSERADSSGATGDRLKEGVLINQSLSTLGNCIRALAEISQGKKNIIVPFRDSVLTKLLRNALGGNSKTIMIAALSPADINYSETLSTLRFAERAKSVKTKAEINESSTEKLVRELKEEIERLKKLLSQTNTTPDIEERKNMEEQIAANKRQLDDMETSYDQRIKGGQTELLEKLAAEKKKAEERKVIPHFWNLSEDPALTGMLIHFCREGTVKIGNKNAVPEAEIIMNGLSIQKEHASVTNNKGTVTLKSLSNAKIFVNGKALQQDQELHHNDRVLFGPNHLFVFHHPQDEAKQRKAGKPVPQPTYDSAQEELAKELGLMAGSSAKSKEDLILQDHLIELLPKVNEANAMSEELDKKVKFEICLISPQSRGLKDGFTEVMVKMKNMESGNWWLLNRNSFVNRKYLMEEMYQNYIEGDSNWDVPKEKDPFWQPHTTPVLIGIAHIYLKSISHLIDMDDSLIIMDFKGKETGHLLIELIPCDGKWNALKDEHFLEHPIELMGRPLYFEFKIKGARGIPANFQTTFCSYKFYLENKPTKTKEISGTMNPDFDHTRQIIFSSVTQQLLDYLSKESVTVEVWGQQKEESVRPKTVNSNSRASKQRETTGSARPQTRGSTELKNINPRNNKQSSNSTKSNDLMSDIEKEIAQAKSMGLDSVPVSVIEKRLAELTGSGSSGLDGNTLGQEKSSKTCSLQ